VKGVEKYFFEKNLATTKIRQFKFSHLTLFGWYYIWAQFKFFSLFHLNNILTTMLIGFFTLPLSSFQDRFKPVLSFPHLLILR